MKTNREKSEVIVKKMEKEIEDYKIKNKIKGKLTDEQIYDLAMKDFFKIG